MQLHIQYFIMHRHYKILNFVPTIRCFVLKNYQHFSSYTLVSSSIIQMEYFCLLSSSTEKKCGHCMVSWSSHVGAGFSDLMKQAHNHM